MAEWSQGDKMTVALMNQKTTYVGTAVPATPYDGQRWVCTSSDPPLVKVYDATNSQWMERHGNYYEEVTSGQMPTSGVYLHGDTCVVYDTEQSSAKFYAYANGSWRDMGGAIVSVYPSADVLQTATKAKGAVSVAWIEYGTAITSGLELVFISTNITPNNSGDYATMFIGGTFAETLGGRLRGYIGSTMIANQALTTTGTPYALCSGIVIANTSTNISVRHYAEVSGDQLWHAGISMATMVTKAA